MSDHGPAGGPPPFQPRLIAWEATRRCPLACRHCRAGAADREFGGELSTEEGYRLLESIASFAHPILILTGGEPMAREDIYRLAARGTELGLRVVMAPCGLLVDRQSVRRMLEAGIRRISLSLDGADARTHDDFRQVEGAFEAVIRAAGLARREGLEFQVNTTVTRLNLGQLDRILRLAVELGAAAFHPFLLVPTGRARDLAELEIDPAEYERALGWLVERGRDTPIQIKPTCAPHYYRIHRQKEKAEGKAAGRPAASAAGAPMPSAPAHGMAAMTRGCLGGQAFAFVSHTGRVQICGFLDLEAGDLRREGLDFRRIWDHSPLFAAVRDPQRYRGRCGRCEYHRVCGGCRARAHALTGDFLAEEPNCTYQPSRRPSGTAP